MHPEICAFSNAYFYGKRLTSAPQTLLANANFALKPYNVFNLKCFQSNHDMINYHNIGEAEFIVTMLKVMVKHAVPGPPDSKDGKFSYGIITPYAKQRAEIHHLLSYVQILFFHSTRKKNPQNINGLFDYFQKIKNISSI